jgi:hypothetical protein
MIGAVSSEKTPAEEPAHDVLAAEEFGVPAPDPGLHHGPVTLPDDPTGIAEPHDVLAAEEFALPAPRGGGAVVAGGRPSRARYVVVGALGLVLLLRLLQKRRT